MCAHRLYLTSSPSQTHGDGIHSPGIHSKCLGLHWPVNIDRLGSKKKLLLYISLHYNIYFVSISFDDSTRKSLINKLQRYTNISTGRNIAIFILSRYYKTPWSRFFSWIRISAVVMRF